MNWRQPMESKFAVPAVSAFLVIWIGFYFLPSCRCSGPAALDPEDVTVRLVCLNPDCDLSGDFTLAQFDDEFKENENGDKLCPDCGQPTIRFDNKSRRPPSP